MYPTLQPGDIVLASPLPYLLVRPRVNDLVVCHDPRDKKILVKRIIKIDNGKYFVTGDNPEESTDSRHFGFIRRDSIIGKVIHILKVSNSM